MQITPVQVDWLTVVCQPIIASSFIRHYLRGETPSPSFKGFHRAASVEYYPSGIKHFFSPSEEELPSILVLSGDTISNIRNEGGNIFVDKLSALFARRGNHFSRIDLALDFMDEGDLSRRFWESANAGKVNFGRRKPKLVKLPTHQGGCTTYIGVRTSPLFMRFYDKNAETSGKVPSSRLEFELKQDYSHAISNEVSSFDGYKRFTSIYVGLLNKLDCWDEFPEFDNVRYGDVTLLDIPKRERLQDKKEWLAKQIAPTFIKDYEGKGGELWEWFKRYIDEAVERE